MAGYDNTFELKTDAVETINVKDEAITSDKIEDDVNLNGSPTTITQDRDLIGAKIATVSHVNKNRSVSALVNSYTSTGQPLNTLNVSLDKVGGLSDTGITTTNVKVGDVIKYYAHDAGQMWFAVIVDILGSHNVRIPANGFTSKGLTTRGFSGGNVGNSFLCLIAPVK